MRTLEENAFFAGKPGEMTLYAELMAKLEEQLPAFGLRVQKTQITLVNPKVFACVSLKWKDCLVITFGLPARLASPRIRWSVEVRPNRWTHHMKVYSADEMDDEFMGWLVAAYDFASDGMK